MKQRSVVVFGLVNIVVEYTLTMIGFHGLITKLEVWKLHHQTLKVGRDQNVFQGNSNKPKCGRDILFRYNMSILVPTVGPHHQTLKANYGQSALKKSPLSPNKARLRCSITEC
ncbi:hypothetical protein EVAR_87584_1 [Eumeta japonica]|uniref:Uncharacterized protein n=1 Tax=Eumeta variegata TaxID=151549 RepID=A0A4C1WPE7_EUMVA|nr:hypothetical protein EVAR_87584_1 [Eumeta japonica]